MENIKLITKNTELSKLFQIESVDNALEKLAEMNYISVDSETNGVDPHINDLLLLQIGNNEIQYVIDVKTTDITVFKQLFESKELIFHNAKFDIKFLFKYGIYPKNIYDTQIAEIILYTGYEFKDKNDPNYLSIRLDSLTERYCNKKLDKSIRGLIHTINLHKNSYSEVELSSIYNVINYAANDIIYLEDIMNKQLKLIKTHKLENVLKLELDVLYVFSLMEYNGISFNTDKHLKTIEFIENKINKLIEELDEIVVQESFTNNKIKHYTKIQLDLFYNFRKTNINWNSNEQKLKLLRNLGINCNNVSDNTLRKIRNQHKIIDKLIEYSKLYKLYSSFGSNLLLSVNSVTNKIHSEIWQILSTGRISMRNPNCQQIPSHSELGREIKSSFIASNGYKIVSADYSNIELRLIAEYSDDPLWINTFNNNEDLHSILCAETFNIPIENVKDPFPDKPDISYRFLQKTINFGISYGMSEHKLSDTAQISVEKAKEIIIKFKSKVPKVVKFLDKASEFAVKHKFIHTDPYFKRIRFFPFLDPSNKITVGDVERAAKNTIPQGSNANIIKYALVNIQQEIDKNNYPVRILLTVHDEIVTECEESFAEEWVKILEKTMIESAKILLKKVIVKVDTVISDFWTD